MKWKGEGVGAERSKEKEGGYCVSEDSRGLVCVCVCRVRVRENDKEWRQEVRVRVCCVIKNEKNE